MFSLPHDRPINKINILEHLTQLIINGTLKTDDVLHNELAIGIHFGVSRTMIRDVLRTLEGKGLIERKTNTGTRVRSSHSWNLFDKEVIYLSNKANIDHNESYKRHKRVLAAIENRSAMEAYAAMGCVLKNTISDRGLQVTEVILSDTDNIP